MNSFKAFLSKVKVRGAIAIITAIILIAGTVYYFTGLSGKKPLTSERVMAAGLALRASVEDSLGIAVDTDFILTSDTALKTSEIEGLLSTKPELGFAVKEVGKSGKGFRITPVNGLEANKIYRFQLGDGSWAFQTKKEFGVVRSLPRDQSEYVPISTGIEITFSHDDFQDIEEYFEIKPKVEGFFERHKKTAVFVPKVLEPGIVYTVTIKKGLGVCDSNETLPEDYLFQFETQPPDALDKGKKPTMETLFSQYIYEYPSRDKPLLDLWFYGYNVDEKDISITADIYEYEDADRFIGALEKFHRVPYWASYSKSIHREDTSKLFKALSFQTPLQRMDHNHYILFPENLKEGHYLADITFIDEVSGTTKAEQIWLQITDTSGYISIADDKTLIWVNSIEKGGPAQGAEVELKNRGKIGKTDGDGLLVVDTSEDMKASPTKEDADYIYFKLKAEGHGDCVIPVFRRGYDHYFGSAPGKDYWDYIYLDRGLYHPLDTVNLWGIIKPMDGGIPRGRLEMELHKSGYYYGGDEDDRSLILKKEISIGKDCTFSGEFTLPNLTPEYYTLVLKLDGKEVSSKWFEVATYIKPAYKIEVKGDKKAVFSGRDSINFKLQASFFEGTPASSMELSYNSTQGPGTVITDEKGQGVITLKPVYNSQYQPQTLQYGYLSIFNRLPEAGDIYINTDYMVFNNDMNLDSSVRATEYGAEINARVDNIDLRLINSGDSERLRREDPADNRPLYIGDPVPGQQITGTIYEIRWRQEERGQYYDFINKEVRTNYYYYPYNVHLEDFVITTDAEGLGTFLFSYEDDKSYSIELETIDGMGRKIKTEQSFHGSKYRNYEAWYWDYYRLAEPGDESVFYGTDEEYFLTFKNGNDVLPEGDKGNYLYISNRKGLKGYEVKNNPYFSARFEEKDMPNLYITGVYFNGRTYYVTSPYLIRYDKEERRLNINATADKEWYSPGEEVTLDFLVKDAKGRPREAEINVSLVDEAMFKLMSEGTDVLTGLYSKILGSGVLSNVYSHRFPDIAGGSGAECGEGGNGEGRKEFEDTAFFGTLRTDAKGKGSLKVRVPDNLTSWRATFQGVTADLYAGTGSISVDVKLPFFTDMVINDSYLEGDRPGIAVRSFGDALKPGDRIEYCVSVPGLLKGEITGTANAFETIYFDMPSLKAGRYPVTVKAVTVDGLTDTLTRELRVYKTYLSKSTVEHYTLKKGIGIKGSEEGLTRLVFTDGSKGKYLYPLYRLYHTYGKRIDQQLASLGAYDLLNEHYDIDIEKPDELKAEQYQMYDGGIALLPYGDSEPGLSVRVASMGAERFDKSLLGGYFDYLLYEGGDTPEDISSALWGLASLERPVLNEIKSMLKSKELGVKMKLQLGLGLWELGDGNAAKAVFNDIVKDNGQVKEPYIIINKGIDRDDLLELTSLAAVLGVRVGASEAEGMYNYIMDNNPEDILIVLEQVMYLSEALPKTAGTPSEVTYRLGGEKVDKKLFQGGTFELLLTPERLAELEIVAVKGDVGLDCIYDREFSAENIQTSEDVSISRQYYVKGKAVKEFNEDDLIKVVIEYSFGDKSLEGSYQVTDFLPSGLKAIAAPYIRGLSMEPNIRYPYEVNGQKASFYLYNTQYFKDRQPIVYYARVVSRGSFRSQGPLIQNMKADGEVKLAKEEQIIIR